MNRLVHVNLLLEEERRGHSPIRPRVMAPMFAFIALLAAVGWAGLALLSNAMIRSGNARAEEQIREQSSTVARYESIVARKAALEAEAGQLDRFLDGRVLFGPALAAVAESVPEDSSLARLELSYPPASATVRPAPGTAKEIKAPPGATLRLQGVTSRPRDVEDLVAAIREGGATNAFVSATVPPGSFRTDVTPGTFRFEIVAAGAPRSFSPPPKTPPRRAPAAAANGGGNAP